jgi:hypothetical protein
MASILKVDTIQDQSGNNIINENADTITIGASGDTITIPAGATLSSTDPLVFPAGTVSLPAITTTGDTNTGIFFPSADTIAFTEGGAEAMRINSDGNVTLTGNIGLGGATPTTSGSGITFPATASASSNANTLDDYEEGTWTPVITAQTGTITSYSAEGKYTKIGDLSYVWIYYNISDVGTGTDNCFISGFPFTAKTTTSAVPFTGVGRNSSNNTGVIQISGNSTSGLVALYNGGVSNNIMASAMSWRFSLTYLTN